MTAEPDSAPARSGLIQLSIREPSALYAAYVPLFTEGGIFIPTTRDWRLGESVRLVLALPDDPHRHEVEGTVAWINPPRAQGHRAQGIGVRFPDNPAARRLRLQIEECLGAMLASERPTQTL